MYADDSVIYVSHKDIGWMEEAQTTKMTNIDKVVREQQFSDSTTAQQHNNDNDNKTAKQQNSVLL